MLVLAYAALGAAIGSFLNVCIDRLPRGASVVTPPSSCDACGRRLTALELIPVISYLALRGRCRTCGKPISPRSPIVELGTASLFGLTWLRFGPSLQTLLVSAYACYLVVTLVIDLEHHRILNKLTYPAIAIALFAAPFVPERSLLQTLGGGAIGFGVLLLIAIVYPGGMGMGDVKLGAFIGLAVGLPGILLALYLSFVLGGVISGLLWLARIVGRRDPIAFGPFLAMGALATLLYGDPLLRWWAGRG
ncbi:MAG TPA: prepilin peptidase [Anaerolineales bacterium]|nr:prepilin peptidase [Anaerolineales bacterium]